MKIKINIDTANDAFQDGGLDHEVYRILAELAERVSEYGVRSSHGNITCGTFKVTR